MANTAGDKNPEEGTALPTHYLQLVLEKKGLFLLIALLVMFGAIAVSYVLPKKYEAESTVFIEQNVISNLVAGIAITPSMDMKIKAIRVTMLSRTMLSKVIKELDLDGLARNLGGLDALIEYLQKQIEVRLDQKKGVFTISIVTKDPVLSRDIVNTLTRIYIEESTSSKRKESYEATQFLAEQIKTFKKRIDDADEKIDAFKSQSGAILSQDEGSIRMSMERNNDQLEALRARANELRSSKQVLVSDSPLRRQLADMEQKLNQLRSRYKESWPEVLQTKAAITNLRAQIRQRGDADLAAVYRSGKYQSIKVELSSVEKMIARLEDENAKNEETLRTIPALRTRLAELERNKQNEVIIYEKLVSRYGQSEVSKEMELQDKAMSFKVLDPAVMPTDPVSPNRPLIILGGIVAGLGLGLLVIILLDLINPSIKSIDELKGFGIPVLAVIPKVRDSELAAEERRRNLKLYLAGGFGFAIVLAFLLKELLKISIPLPWAG